VTDSRRRAILAALIGVLGASVGVAGAGHVYLREWRRAVAWFTFVLGVGLVLLSVFTDPVSIVNTDPTDVPTTVTAPLFFLLFLSSLDAYYVASRGVQREGDGDGGTKCPHCGGELDPDVAFCPWCATELDGRTVRVDEVDRLDAE
jgi:drug/metabolite transporter (DMT)-like permease